MFVTEMLQKRMVVGVSMNKNFILDIVKHVDKNNVTKKRIIQPKEVIASAVVLLGCVFVLGSSIAVTSDKGHEEIEQATQKGYVAIVSGEEVGIVSDANGIQDAYVAAKNRVFVESGNYSENDLLIVEKEVQAQDMIAYGEMQDNMYQVMMNSSEAIDYVYKLSIGERSVVFSSIEETEAFLNQFLSDYKHKDLFAAAIVLDSEGNASVAYVDQKKIESVKTKGVITEEDCFVSLDGKEYSLSLTKEFTVLPKVEGTVRLSTKESIQKVLDEPESAKITYRIEEGDSLSSVADDFGLTIDELLEINPEYDYDQILQIGDAFVVGAEVPYIQLKEVTKETKKVVIPYEIVEIPNDDMYEDEEYVIEAGSDGSKLVTYLTSYVNGEEESKVIVNEEITKESKTQFVDVGTKVRNSFVKPLYGGVYSSGYGVIDEGRTTPHNGVDWACEIGTEILASQSGTVIYSDYHYGDYGYMVEILHENGFVTRYAHLSECVAKVGDYVKQGELIAYSGNTGFTTGPHIHLEILVNGWPVDPEDYLVNY